MACRCYDCTVAAVRDEPCHPLDRVFGQDPRMMQMFICQRCGNKRCPHAKSHLNPCTRSNDPGQKGSLYAAHQRR